MSIQHEDTKKWLQDHSKDFGKTLIAACGPQMGIDKRFCGKRCRRKDAVIFRPEQNIRYRHIESDRFGEGKTKHFQNDGVAYIRPGRWGLNDVPSELKTFSVGLEIKEEISDLHGDTKCLYYLGWTDFYFFVVPRELKAAAMEKIRKLNDARFGLITIDGNGFTVWIVPLRQQVFPQNQYALALQAMFSESTGNAECIIDWDGYASEGAVDVDAYRNAVKGIHPEYAGAEDTFINLVKSGVCDTQGNNLSLKNESAENLNTGTAVNHSGFLYSTEDKKAQAAKARAAKENREKELIEKLGKITDREIRCRLVILDFDTQSIYYAIREAVNNSVNNTAAVSTETIAKQFRISTRKVKGCIKSLREKGLIQTEGDRNSPSFHILSNLESSEHDGCLLYNSVKSTSEKRKMEIICRECSHSNCPAHK